MLEKYNDILLDGAKELRYEYQHTILKKPRKIAEPCNVWRSCSYKNPNEYLFVIDIDWDNFDEIIYDKTISIYNCIEKKPALKFSGKKGMQFIWKLQSIKTTNAPLSEYAKEICKTIHRKYASPLGLQIGKRSKAWAPTAPYFDLAMYDIRRMFRTFGTRFDKGKIYKYNSIPLSGKETYQEMLKCSANPELINIDWNIPTMSPDFTLNLSKNPIKPQSPITPIPTINHYPTALKSKDLTDNPIYQRLTGYLKDVVRSNHPTHNCKWELVAFLYKYLHLNEDEIIAFLDSAVSWVDYNNPVITKYHVRYTVARMQNGADVPEIVWSDIL